MSLRQIFEQLRNELDKQVKSLSPGEYREILEELACEIKCRLDCLDDEQSAQE